MTDGIGTVAKTKPTDNGARRILCQDSVNTGKFWKSAGCIFRALEQVNLATAVEDTITTRKNLLIRVLWREELKL